MSNKLTNIKHTKIITDENRELLKSHGITEKEIININSTIITPPKINKENKRVTAQFKDTINNAAFYIQTPAVKLPFGASAYETKDIKTWSIMAKASGEKQDEINFFMAYLKQIQELSKEYCATHSSTIYKKALTKEQIDAADKFKGCIKETNDKDGNPYPPSITFKIATDPEKNNNVPLLEVYKMVNGTPQIQVINSMEELPGLIPKGSDAFCLFKLNIYFVNGNAGINLKLFQIIVLESIRYSSPTGAGVFVFSEDLKSNKKIENSPAEDVKVIEDKKNEESVEVEDSEEEEEEEDDEEEVA